MGLYASVSSVSNHVGHMTRMFFTIQLPYNSQSTVALTVPVHPYKSECGFKQRTITKTYKKAAPQSILHSTICTNIALLYHTFRACYITSGSGTERCQWICTSLISKPTKEIPHESTGLHLRNGLHDATRLYNRAPNRPPALSFHMFNGYRMCYQSWEQIFLRTMIYADWCKFCKFL
jgi:hypothetical protein